MRFSEWAKSPRTVALMARCKEAESQKAWAQLALAEAVKANERLSAQQRLLEKIWLTLHPEERVLSQVPLLTPTESEALRRIHQEG